MIKSARVSHQKGFTLIELIVSTAIGLILVAAGIAAYRGMGEKQGLKQESLTFQANLKSFQQKALAGEKPTGCIGTLQGFRVRYVDEDSYSVQSECAFVDGVLTEFDLAGGVNFTASFSADIFFPTLKSDLEGEQTVTLNSENDSWQYGVEIENGGLIRGEML